MVQKLSDTGVEGISHSESGNLYDDVRIDIEKAHESRSFEHGTKREINKKSYYFTGLLQKTNLYEKLVDAGFVRDWFDEFTDYWENCLECRPLSFYDFFYLKNKYREKIQFHEIDESDANSFRHSWQSYENINSIFDQSYSYGSEPITGTLHQTREYLKDSNSILEYGCGIAPITYKSIQFGVNSSGNYTLADIRGFRYHYGKWRLVQEGNVDFIDITNPMEPPELSSKFDIIYMITVLEHLPNPLKVVNHLYGYLNSGGYLVFNYPKSEGVSYDTDAAVREREEVLDFIQNNYIIKMGEINKDENTPLTVAEKK